jgi:hypothetical protein
MTARTGPPEKEEGRTPCQGRPSNPTNAISDHDDADTGESSSVACSESIATQLRRRREASYRLQPLKSGKRDPWGAPSHDR